MRTQSVPRRTLLSLNTSLDVLEMLGASKLPMSLAEIARGLGKSKAAVHTVLANLESRGYVDRTFGGSAFVLGIQLWMLGLVAGEQIDLRRLSKPVLADLTAKTGESSQVAIYHPPGEVQYLERALSPNPVQVIVGLGERAPAYCVAIGRALLAFQEHNEIDRALAGKLERHSKKTITDRKLIKRQLELVRERGYAINAGEYRGEIVGVAAPIRDHKGKVVAALSVYGPEYRFSPERAESFARAVIDAAKVISAKLGFGRESDAGPVKRKYAAAEAAG